MRILLEQFDNSPQAILEPHMVAPPIEGFPRRVLTCFSKKLLQEALRGRKTEVICELDTEDGNVPVYVFEEEGICYGAYMSRVGAPACAVGMEEVISRGAQTILMFGSCGVLEEDIPKWGLIVPEAAMRDEGVSYHYLPASAEVELSRSAVEAVCKALAERGESVQRGKVWTTDAIYRETEEKMRCRKSQGCIAVDMECAAAAAVAEFRGIRFGQFFYTEDLLSAQGWDSRGLTDGVQTQAQRLFSLALCCLKAL